MSPKHRIPVRTWTDLPESHDNVQKRLCRQDTGVPAVREARRPNGIRRLLRRGGADDGAVPGTGTGNDDSQEGTEGRHRDRGGTRFSTVKIEYL